MPSDTYARCEKSARPCLWRHHRERGCGTAESRDARNIDAQCGDPFDQWTGLASIVRVESDRVEEEYNSREHSALHMRPIDRFGLDLSRIRFLPPNQVNEELFFVEEDRTVLADNTFSLKTVRFEAPRDLRSRKIQVRFDRKHFGRVVAYYKNERMGDAHPVDFLANDRMPAPSKEGKS